MRERFLIVIAGFAVGIAFRSLFDFGWPFAVFLLMLGIILIIYFFFLHRTNDLLKSDLNKSFVLVAGLFVFAAGAGVLRFSLSEDGARGRALDPYLGATTILEGTIADEPDARETHTKLTIAVTSVGAGEKKTALSTKILVMAAPYPAFSYGDTVIIRGAPQKPEKAIIDEEGVGHPFNYRAYLGKDGIYYTMFYPHIERVSSDGGNPLRRALFGIKHGYLRGLARVLPEPHASLAGGITVGAKEALGGELLEQFRRVGIIHIVVLSGYNITIVAQAFGRAASFLPRLGGIGFSSLSIVLFALMTGAGATVLRASFMALLVLLARATGRVSDMKAALFAAGFFMLLANPQILAFDPSFQLSFLATAGLLFLAPRAEPFFRWLPAAWGIREAATATIATQAFVLPALIFMMGEFSIVGFFANVLILPLMPLAMFFSFCAGAVGALSSAAGAAPAFAAYGLLEYAFAVTRFFAGLPFAAVSVPDGILVVSALFIYAALLLVLFGGLTVFNEKT